MQSSKPGDTANRNRPRLSQGHGAAFGPATCGEALALDFFEEFSGLGALQSTEAKRRRFWLGGTALFAILAALAALYQFGYL
jgi:hypothetical protein